MKRKRPPRTSQQPSKKPKIDAPPRATDALLKRYYPEVVTLRQYLASRLSKKRRKRLHQYGNTCDGAYAALVELLDTTIIGTFQHVHTEDSSFAEEEIAVFTQQLTATDASSILTPGEFKQSEIVDFVIWLLFRKHYGNTRPKHLLCQNFQKYLNDASHGQDPGVVAGIPGIYASGPNDHVKALRNQPWSNLPSVLGKSAERVLTDLLVDCGIFVPIRGSNNVSQLSGVPMCDLQQIAVSTNLAVEPGSGKETPDQPVPISNATKRGLSNIRFIRHRMLYASASLSSKGGVRFGLNSAHVLNRCRDRNDAEETRHIMKYIFPKQFGLHNVLSSPRDIKGSAHLFKDYTNREQEISRLNKINIRRDKVTGGALRKSTSLPKRLRSGPQKLVDRIRKRHFECAYSTLLDYYCPRQTDHDENAAGSIKQASDVAQVSAFCRSAVKRVFPRAFGGSGSPMKSNERVLYRNIDKFVRLRRYESMSLHDVLQDMKLAEIEWLIPPNISKDANLSKSEFAKRKEILAELLYYIFDSYLIPLIRAHFHVTESNAQRNQIFYFRHDTWKAMSEPALASLKLDMLEELSGPAVTKALSGRCLGVSNVRLVPKTQGMRPIINLRRRVQKLQGGQLVLGKSINSLLTPAFSILNYEKAANPATLGSALFSVDDIFPRLQSFRQMLAQKGLLHKRLYFAKADVQACFDSIPQPQLLQLARKIIGAESYHVARYSMGKLTGGHTNEVPGFGAKPSWKFPTKAVDAARAFDFRKEIEADTLEGRNRSVYINGIAQRKQSRKAILGMLQEHVESNLIKLGKRVYRQKVGIPQGSIVSRLLCSYFYAELERKALGFIDDGNSVFLRLIDDFMVISTEQDVAAEFMRVMHAGIPDFGIKVKADKSRVNFDLRIGNQPVTKVPDDSDFPYCGNTINTVTLDLSKDQERKRQNNLADSITVEYSKLPGQSFYRKNLNALKLQMHAMLLSTAYNTIETVLSNLYHSFLEVAQKSYHYIRSLPTSKQPSSKLIIRALDDSTKLASVLMRRRRRTSKDVIPYECCVNDTQARWLACSAYTVVFRRRQTKFTGVLQMLEQQMLGLRMSGAERRLLEAAASKAKV